MDVWLGILAIGLLFAASIWLINRADGTKPADWKDDQLTYIPSGRMLKPMMMDLDEAAGDLFWIKSMIYFADAYLAKQSFKWLGHMIDVVTILNPHLYAAYEFGGVVLTKEKRELPKTLKLLDRGSPYSRMIGGSACTRRPRACPLTPISPSRRNT